MIETLALGSQLVFVWCNVVLPDNSLSYRADMKVRERQVAEESVRGGGSGNRRTQAKKSASDDLMEWRLNPTLNRKSVEECAQCVKCVSVFENDHDCGAEGVRVRVCICAQMWLAQHDDQFLLLSGCNPNTLDAK